MNKKIKKITIKTTSGYCCYDHAYEDKIVITEHSLTYANKPMYPDSIYNPVKWSYKSNSKSFKDWFNELFEICNSCLLNAPFDQVYNDCGDMIITFFYEDGGKDVNDFAFTDHFDNMLRHLLKMVPSAEDRPVCCEFLEE